MKISSKFWQKPTSEAADYQRLLHGEEHETPPEMPSILSKHSRGTPMASFLTGVFATTLITILAFLFWLHPLKDHECVLHTSWPTPITKDLRITYHTQDFNGSFFKKTIYRQDASPEVDEAWEALGTNYRPGIISEQEALAAGIRPDQVRLSEKYGGGFIAYVDGLHQLHCLNLLRQALSWNINYYEALGTGPFVNNRTVLKTHVTHCLDSIRQQLMCSVDTGLLGEVWFWPTDPDVVGPRPFVDFNTQHKCRNFDDIRQWAEARQMPDMEIPADYFRPPQAGDRIYDGTP